ncbi:MAG: S53 family peptidase [Acidobacteriaceae bacterium]
MTFRTKFQKLGALPAISLALGLSIAPLAYAQTAQRSSLLAHADSVSPANTGQTLEATVWLKLQNKDALDAAVAQMYEPGSATYHQWLTDAELARYQPTAAQAATVAKELSSKNLTVVQDPSQTLFVKVRGSVGAMQSAFNTRINEYTVKGKNFTAAASEPQLSGAAAGLVSQVNVSGARMMEPYARRAMNPDTHKPYAGVPAAKFAAAPNGAFFASYCFFAQPEKKYFTTAGAKLPTAVYYGNRYGANPTNTQLGNLAPCGYSPHDVRMAYNLNPVYKQGLNGAGQTIVIVDAHGSPTIQDDANVYSQINSLPLLNSSNFHIYYPSGPAAPDPGWAAEVTIDVEWAHAIAPGAKIALVVAPTSFDTDLQAAVAYAIGHHLGNVISNSYGGPESEDNASNMLIWNSVNELGAAKGISVNYSTGDSGDFSFSTMDGKPTVSVPSNSPYATAVGGTTLALDGNQNLKFQTGWGNNYSEIYSGTHKQVLDPPAAFGFYAGAGGGESQFFAKPSWQKNLPGTGRQQPDVSALADPFTGGEIVFTDGGVQQVEVYGGTSLACPIFSGVWAIANQKAKHALGQAAPIISRLSSSALFDITDYAAGYNPNGNVTDAKGTTHYTASDLVQPLFNTKKYFSAFYPVASGTYYVFSFGTDTSLTTGPGWDNVTGYGVPNGLNFINQAAAH